MAVELAVDFALFALKHLCTVLSDFYPMLGTYRAIKSKNHRSQNRWLLFWIVFCPFLILEHIPFVTTWVSIYYELKFLLITLIVAHEFEIVYRVYDAIVAPFLTRHESSIDQSILTLKEKASVTASEWKAAGIQQIRKRSVDLLAKSQNLMISSMNAHSESSSSSAAPLLSHSLNPPNNAPAEGVQSPSQRLRPPALSLNDGRLAFADHASLLARRSAVPTAAALDLTVRQQRDDLYAQVSAMNVQLGSSNKGGSSSRMANSVLLQPGAEGFRISS